MRTKMKKTKNSDRKRENVMNKLKESVLFRLSALNPSICFNSSAHHIDSLLQNRLQQLFSSFRTPSHPPYALMIKRAIEELNEESGSTEEAISEFIKGKYEDLPWAHVRILDLHLRKLCLDGDLMRTESGRYVLPVDCDTIGNVEEEIECEPHKKRWKTCEEGIERDNGVQNQEQIPVSEFHSSRASNRRRLVKLADRSEERGKPKMRLPRKVHIEQHDNGVQNQEQIPVSEFHSSRASNRRRLVKLADSSEERGKPKMRLPQKVHIEQQNQSACQGGGATKEHDEASRWRLVKVKN